MSGASLLTILDCVFSGNMVEGTDGDGGAIRIAEWATIDISNSSFTGNSAGYFGGALSIESIDNVCVQMNGGSFVGNQAETGGAALYSSLSYTYPAVREFTLTGVLIDGNTVVSDEGGAMKLQSSTWPQTLTLDGCTVTGNTGGGALLSACADVTLSSLDTDWGTGATDNTPHDVAVYNGPTYDIYGANATFTCTGDLGCQ